MTSSKNPVREFIETLRRIRTGHENLKVSSGIPGFIPGTGERVDAFGCCVQAADGIEFEGVKEPCTPSVLRGQRLLQRDEGSKSTLCHKPSWSPYHG